jgi:hypothetical protein
MARIYGYGGQVLAKFLLTPRSFLAKPAPTETLHGLPQPRPHRRYHH